MTGTESNIEKQDEKPWYQSKTIIGSIVSVLAVAAASLLDVNITDQDQGVITDVILGIVAGAGSLLAIYGRIKAETKIK